MGTIGIRLGEMPSLMCSGRHTYLTTPTNSDENPVAEASIFDPGDDVEVAVPFGKVFYFDRDRDLAVA